MKLGINCLLLIVVALIPDLASAQGWGYSNNRIAISADGNNQPDHMHRWSKADPDDWGGTPVALAMIAKLQAQDKLVHFSYNNFIDAPAHTSATNHMKIGVDGAIERWNFDKNIFFDVPEDNEAAINDLVEEIEKSTATDPLYFIHMGPAEFLYRAVKQVIEDNKSETLSHIYIISHSGYNEKHLRRGDPKFDKKPVSASDKHHTIAETMELSGHRLNYRKIIDQNAHWDPNKLFGSDDDFTVWYWMRDHKDPNIKWLYDRMLVNEKGKADCSDAGMVYYLLTGDDNGSPSKLEKFFGEGIPTNNLTGSVESQTLNALRDFNIPSIDGFVPAYKDKGRRALAVNAGMYKEKFAAATAIFDGNSGLYNVTITTVKETDGESTYRLRVSGELVGKFQNPETTQDMSTHTYTFQNIALNKDDVIQVEFNSTSNGKIPEGNAFAFARGRWRQLEIVKTN